MKKKVRLKKEVKYGFIGIVVLIIAIVFLVQFISYRTSTKYKLKDLGYTTEEVTTIIEKLDHEQVKDILKMEYNQNIVLFLQEKYFIYDNLGRYLDYQKENQDKSTSDVVAMVNVNRDRDFYTDTKETDLSLGDLILVNKYYSLPDDYEPENIVKMNLQYAYDDNSIRDYVYDAFLEMYRAAMEEGYQLITNSSYRDYDWQDTLYNNYKTSRGQEYADAFAARPGYSEHQTGLALDITCYNCTNGTFDDFAESEEYQWLLKNSYKYGFILRYPEGKEDITGYNFEAWHFRYVGKDMAKKIYNSGLTFDEYYAYYIEK